MYNSNYVGQKITAIVNGAYCDKCIVTGFAPFEGEDKAIIMIVDDRQNKFCSCCYDIIVMEVRK